ncbi:hypothetical protein EJ03DRAFT_178715 [Teratosphaeria nubilosa]|uniref:Concanavalin A-like lectin/glucanase n=1 Tax=Teratosphaeria nubilosa TaxID=161662 RepID=A0A6G1L2C5_9PEZI|nr:hypothetical protein EJ03DRAFT_178715 [Teratosphaeria nubilosa]
MRSRPQTPSIKGSDFSISFRNIHNTNLPWASSRLSFTITNKQQRNRTTQLSTIVGLVLGATTVVAAAAPTIDVPSAFAKRDNTRFGNGFVTNWTSDRSWILEATTTLILPALNSPQVASSALGLWPGIETPAGDLIQGLAISDADSYYCTHNQGEWCIVTAASVAGQMQYGANTSATAGSKITFHYVYNQGSSSYEQYISINGTAVSSISTPLNHGQKWGTAIECQTPPCGTIDAHQYV